MIYFGVGCEGAAVCVLTAIYPNGRKQWLIPRLTSSTSATSWSIGVVFLQGEDDRLFSWSVTDIQAGGLAEERRGASVNQLLLTSMETLRKTNH